METGKQVFILGLKRNELHVVRRRLRYKALGQSRYCESFQASPNSIGKNKLRGARSENKTKKKSDTHSSVTNPLRPPSPVTTSNPLELIKRGVGHAGEKECTSFTHKCQSITCLRHLLRSSQDKLKGEGKKGKHKSAHTCITCSTIPRARFRSTGPGSARGAEWHRQAQRRRTALQY